MYCLDVPEVIQLIHNYSLTQLMGDLMICLADDYRRWDDFALSSRHASYVPGGVIELMPIYDSKRYACKLVNCHPGNPQKKLLSVMGLGFLVDVATGKPLLLSEMTLLTAVRTACMGALVAQYCAAPTSNCLGILGLGAQAEFQVLAMQQVFPIKKVYCFDPDRDAVDKFMRHMAKFNLDCQLCRHPQEAVSQVDICITTTAGHDSTAPIVVDEWVHPTLHLSAIGGDGPGKTELDQRTLLKAQIVVAYLPQTQVEGEIQQVDSKKLDIIQFSDLVLRPQPKLHQKMTLFDSVGFALEDFTVLNWLYEHALKKGLKNTLNLTPKPLHNKDLFGLLDDPFYGS
jgi:ornithine cyclodeaminase